MHHHRRQPACEEVKTKSGVPGQHLSELVGDASWVGVGLDGDVGCVCGHLVAVGDDLDGGGHVDEDGRGLNVRGRCVESCSEHQLLRHMSCAVHYSSACVMHYL